MILLPSEMKTQCLQISHLAGFASSRRQRLEGSRRGYPEAGYLLDCLVDYALAAAVPDAGLPVLSAEDARAVFRVGSQANVP